MYLGCSIWETRTRDGMSDGIITKRVFEATRFTDETRREGAGMIPRVPLLFFARAIQDRGR